MGKCLIVPGGTSAELIGTALPKHVIEGQTFYNTNEEELLTGEIPVQGDVTITPTESTQNAYVTGKYMEGDVKVGAISKTYVGSGVTRQAAKTVSPTESEQTVVANGVYTTGAVKVGAISSTYVGSGVTKRTSSNLSVSSAGLITAPAGYYSSAATKQLTTTAAKTITPSTASQTAVNAGVYTTGAIKVAAIPSTYVNISSGATVFKNGVWGSFMDVAIDGVKWADGKTSTVDSNWEYIVGPISKRGSSSWQGTINDGCLYAKGYGVFLSFVTNKSVNLTPFKTLRVYVWTTTSYARLYTYIIPTDKAGLYKNDRDLNTSYTFSNPQILNIDISRFTGHHFFNIHTSGLKGGEAGFKEIILLS